MSQLSNNNSMQSKITDDFVVAKPIYKSFNICQSMLYT